MSGNIVATLRDTAQLSCIGDASASVWMPEWLRKELTAAADAIDERDAELARLRAELATANATIAELRGRAGAVPDGWLLVPAEPTEDMMDAGNTSRIYREDSDPDPDNTRLTWEAMLAAAPQPTQEAAQPVAWGMPNTAITGGNRWLMVRESIPSDDQYGGAFWVPLYAAPQPAAAQAPEAQDARDALAWAPIETAPWGRILVVGWPDDDEFNRVGLAFDSLEGGRWMEWGNVVSSDDDSDAPPCAPPYTHWLELPALPIASDAAKGAGHD